VADPSSLLDVVACANASRGDLFQALPTALSDVFAGVTKDSTLRASLMAHSLRYVGAVFVFCHRLIISCAGVMLMNVYWLVRDADMCPLGPDTCAACVIVDCIHKMERETRSAVLRAVKHVIVPAA